MYPIRECRFKRYATNLFNNTNKIPILARVEICAVDKVVRLNFTEIKNNIII